MNVPRYRPESWVLFYRHKLAGMGRVVGAYVEDHEKPGEWIYTIDMGEAVGEPHYNDVSESDIFGVLNHGTQWKPTEEELTEL